MEQFFSRVAGKSATAMGHPYTFVLATLAMVAWAARGVVFAWSDTWQLIVNTGTSVVTFLAVFVIQNSQNRDGAAIQAKLDEVLRALPKAREAFVGIEHLTEAQICALRDALEREVKGKGSKQETADDSAERLLKRIG
ncbi:low affinity iron permease family protein [Sphingomonas sp.]|uniref:low affinity iron permease family protein n=1 Tax=Sphingomonas sp. TaxID=28214 RepID=UPI0035BC672E